MKALVLAAPNCLEYRQIPVPEINSEEVLVRIETASICNGSDPAILCGATWDAFPAVMGHEAFGEIVRVGESVTQFHPGDKVVWWFSMGAFAEYAKVNVSEVAMVKLNGCESPQELPLLELLIAAYRAVAAVDVQNKHVLIIGMGPSGLLMTQLCRVLGADTVTAWEISEKRKQMATFFGAEDYDGEFDIVIDAYGDDLTQDKDTINQAMKRLKRFGTLVLYGHPIHGRTINSYLFQSRNIQIKAPVSDIHEIRMIAESALMLYQAGKINLKKMVSRVIAFEDIVEYIGNTDDEVKVVVEIKGEA